MTKAARQPLRVHPAIAVAIIVLCVGFLIVAFFPIFVIVGQWFAVALLLLAFRYWPPMFRWVKSMPVPHRCVFGAIVGAMVLGHLTIRPLSYFPFIPWYIFPAVREVDPVTCPEFIGTTSDGHKVRLLVEQLFPSIVQIHPLEYPPVKDGHFPAGSIDHLAHALARAYNAHHANDPVQQVDLMLMAVHLHPASGEYRSQPSCELLKSYNVSLDQ